MEIISNNITILIVIKVCHLLIRGSLDEVDMISISWIDKRIVIHFGRYALNKLDFWKKNCGNDRVIE